MATSSQIQPAVLHVLVIVRQPSLRDSLVQVMGGLDSEIQWTDADTHEEIVAALEKQPDLILTDPFAIDKTDIIPYYKSLHHRAGSVPLIALLPSDTPDYRDAAVKMGANYALAWSEVNNDLLPAIVRLLERSRLINGISRYVTNHALESAPVGESAFKSTDMTIAARSDLAVEKLASRISTPPRPAKNTSNNPLFNSSQPTFLRGLAVSAASQVSPGAERVFRTACNLNCGSHFCGLNVTLRGNDIVKIEPADFPDPRYRHLCMKGISHVQMQAHPQRLLNPLKRVGERGGNQWEKISWDQALDEITAKMQTIIMSLGAKSITFLPYSGQLSVLNGINGVYLRLAAMLGASGTNLREFGLDSAVPSGIEDTLGTGSAYLANDFTDLPNSRLVLIWGGNPAQSNMNWWPFFMDAKRAGTRLVTIDPHFSLTASKSDAWIPIRPGKDLYLALAMLRLIIEKDWMDHAFVLKHTVAPLLVRDDNGQFLRTGKPSINGEQTEGLVWDAESQKAISAGEANSPALSGRHRVAGVPCRTALDRLREMLQPYTPEFISAKCGLEAEQIEQLAHEYATTKPARIFTLFGIDRWHHGATFGRLIATLAAFTGNLGIPGGGAGVGGSPDSLMPASEFPTPDGRQHRPINPLLLPDQILSGLPYPIKAVFVAFGNWLNQFPDQNRIRQEVLPQLDLLVVADHFITETARWADYVLPAATFFEREDMVKGPGSYVQYQPAMVPPAGECRSDFEIAAALAERLGCGEAFAQTPQEYLAKVLAYNESTRSISPEELHKNGVMEQCLPPNWEVVHHERRFKTSTGRVEFYVERLLPFDRALPAYESPVEAFAENEQARQYPLICLIEHSRYRVHSTFSNAPWLREIESEPRAAIHPDEAGQRGIVESDFVRVFNTRGFVVLRAHLTQAVPLGTVYMSQGWQSTDFRAGHTQTLTHGLVNPANAFGPNSSFSDVLVEIVKEEGKAQ